MMRCTKGPSPCRTKAMRGSQGKAGSDTAAMAVTAPQGSLLRLVAQYCKFGVVGGLATLTHVTVFAGLIELLAVKPLLSNLIAFVIAVGVSFYGHFNWTFAADWRDFDSRPDAGGALAKFAVVALTGLVLNTAVVYVITENLQLSYRYAVVLMVTVVPLVLFVMNKLWAFRHPAEGAANGKP